MNMEWVLVMVIILYGSIILMSFWGLKQIKENKKLKKKMNYINAICRTNLDDYTCHVTKFVALPRIGDRVDVIHRNHVNPTLKVVQITHRMKVNGDPFIEVELNK